MADYYAGEAGPALPATMAQEDSQREYARLHARIFVNTLLAQSKRNEPLHIHTHARSQCNVEMPQCAETVREVSIRWSIDSPGVCSTTAVCEDLPVSPHVIESSCIT